MICSRDNPKVFGKSRTNDLVFPGLSDSPPVEAKDKSSLDRGHISEYKTVATPSPLKRQSYKIQKINS